MSEAPHRNDDVEVRDGCAFYRPTGEVTLAQATKLCDQAIAFARERRVPKLFINVHDLSGFPSPTLAERYFLARQWANTAGGKVQLALVVHQTMIDPEKFGIMVARNVGMNAEVFPEEAAALDWLLQSGLSKP
ncbi:MAG: hypothetical protein QM813_12340 [Verrucomicrobiota bacterium]